MPLMEFVFAPDIANGEEAAALVKELSLILLRLGVSSCKMEEGALRVDANISVRGKGSSDLGTRTEVKNIGSVRGVAQAVDYEISRQINLVENGGTVTNETRNWDVASRKTIKMRDKEVVLDYRFMPEPNLLPLNILETSSIASTIPELPQETRRRLEVDFKVRKEAVINLVEDQKLLELFEAIVGPRRPPKLVANILINNLRAVYNKHKIAIADGPIEAEKLRQLVDKLVDETINKNFIEPILDISVEQDKSIEMIIEENNFKQIIDEKRIAAVCAKVIEENPKLVKQYKAGKEKFLLALIGIISKIDDGRINLAKAAEVLKKLLKN